MIAIIQWLINAKECRIQHEVFQEFFSAHLASSTDGESIEVRTDEGGGPKCRRNGTGWGEGDASDEHCRDVDARAAREYSVQKRRLQELGQSRGIENGKPLALPQNYLPYLCNRRSGSLGNRLHVSRPISDLVKHLRAPRNLDGRCSSIWKRTRKIWVILCLR